MEDLENIFQNAQIIDSVDWFAYPEYSLKYSLPSFKIVDGLYYLNAIEWAASAMEMSMIGAKNVALLTCEKLSICNRSSLRSTTPKSDL